MSNYRSIFFKKFIYMQYILIFFVKNVNETLLFKGIIYLIC